MEKRRTMRPVRHRDIETLYARLGSPVAFYLSLSQLAGSIPAGLLLSQSLYWTSHGRDIDANDGWFHKTHEQWQQETALTRAEQETARKRLRARGLLQEAYRGMPRRLWYRIDLARLGDLLGQPSGCELSRAALRERDRFPWVRRLLGPIQWFHREFAPAAGSVPAALLLSTMLSYFQRRARREPSVPYLDLVQADWSRATGMKRDQLDRARSALRVRHMVSETRMGLPPRVTVSIDLANIAARLSEPIRPRQPAAIPARPAGAERDSHGSRPDPLETSQLPSVAAMNPAKTRARQQQSGSAHLVFTNSPSCFQDSCNLPARFPQISLRDFHTSACRMTANQYAGLPQILYRGLLTTSLRLQPPSPGLRPMDPRGSRRSGGEQYWDNGPSPDRRPAAGLEVVSAVDVDGGAGIPAPADGERGELLSEVTGAADALIVPAFEIPTLERSARSLIGHWQASTKVKQEILDELAGALHAGRVRNPVRYLQSLIAAADNHRFVPALGPAIAAARRRAASIRASHEAAESAMRDRLAAAPEIAAQAWARSKSADASLAAIRDLVGIRRKGDP
ncbi:hypothetical protein [Burkholderia gladioli]|uniref:hypothetical protein n=1 Tax=Burkholderia gladioli TaxID=28095 RepID=UPI00163FAD17|nr:hypothetical protein [Burkholderia gladioli]MDN7813729.1 hypothetical protein [Burkholderia gladioli]